MTISKAPCLNAMAMQFVSSRPARVRRTLSFRAATGGGGARQRKRPGRTGNPLRAGKLLCGPKVCRLEDLKRRPMPGARPAADRRCPGQNTSASARPLPRRAQLLTLPENPYPLIERVAVNAGKTPYVRFDLNDYSIPHTHVRRLLTVLADPTRCASSMAQILAGHRRSYDKGEQIEEPPTSRPWSSTNTPHASIAALTSRKGGAAEPDLLLRAAERGNNLGAITVALLGCWNATALPS